MDFCCTGADVIVIVNICDGCDVTAAFVSVDSQMWW